MNIFEYLNLRSQWEDLVADFKLPDHRKVGTIDNLRFFVEYGLAGNRFRSGYKEATAIAQSLVDSYDKPVAVLEKQLA